MCSTEVHDDLCVASTLYAVASERRGVLWSVGVTEASREGGNQDGW